MTPKQEQEKMDSFFETREFDEVDDWRLYPELGEEVEDEYGEEDGEEESGED